ncbi:hypothetical protein TRVL_07116 [Trypanosoma vivax]|nr:hypothetical protein TRVL_07116 [Trypanosoma vivax]
MAHVRVLLRTHFVHFHVLRGRNKCSAAQGPSVERYARCKSHCFSFNGVEGPPCRNSGVDTVDKQRKHTQTLLPMCDWLNAKVASTLLETQKKNGMEGRDLTQEQKTAAVQQKCRCTHEPLDQTTGEEEAKLRQQ